MAGRVEFRLNGRAVDVAADGSLLDALRDGLGVRSPKDGCAPQGQCGCCTVWVDGQARVSCVTPVARVAGREVTTVEGLADGTGDRWAEALCATGGSQCGFCTPGIVMRLAALPTPVADAAARQALLAHVCRCTGWQTILDAAALATSPDSTSPNGSNDIIEAAAADPVADGPSGAPGGGAADPVAGGAGGASDVAAVGRVVGAAGGTSEIAAADVAGGVSSGAAADPVVAADVVVGGSGGASDGDVRLGGGRDLDGARRRAALEGGATQDVGSHVALGRGGFADDTAPADALVAMRTADGDWAVAGSVAEARRAAGKVQGRKSTIGLHWPIDVPAGDWARTLQTTWAEPAYLEPDAAWCSPSAEPVGPLTNGGAFGAKHPELDGTVDVAAVARRLADEHGRPVRVLLAREDAVRLTPKRPPLAAGVRADGTGVVRVARTPGIADAIHAVAPGFEVEELDVPGPPTSVHLRAAGWAEAAALLAAIASPAAATVRAGGEAAAAGGAVPPAETAAVSVASATADGAAAPLADQVLAREVPPVAWSDGARLTDQVTAPNGAWAAAGIDADGTVHVHVRCGRALDDVVLRSYCIGAAHMGLGWVRSEGIAVDDEGTVHDLTIRSFGVIRAVDTPRIEVTIQPDDGEPVNGSDAVFAAVAAAAWRHAGFPERWPIAR